MKLYKNVMVSAVLVAGLATPALSGPVGVSGTRVSNAQNATIARLEATAQKALDDGRNGNKNSAEFLRKNYEINFLIARLQSGQQIDPSEIDKSFEPVHVW